MAKKNLSALISGIMGQPEEQDTETMSPTIQESTSDTSDTSSTDTKATPEVKTEGKKRSRPKDSNKKCTQATTIKADPEVMRKMKYISLMDDKMYQDIINEAFTAYIAQWETINGRIRLPQKKQ